ncbi:MAG: U32 family peptidase [Lachnospiraceae bacterium]|nr:U32 family peptidase [Lachnospiraceae bacterium]
MNRPEILAPAGSMKAMEAAIKAGADAVYMGGSRFGARAYADNPDQDELIQAIQYVHLYGKKLYLTLNTLLKEEELHQVGDFLLPYYNAGLDGIIIQDPGVFSYVKNNFPGLALHASTQMNITGTASARLLKEAGAVRVVPARELSFEEIRAIKDETGLEIETFVHGALCYCYSGRCLMSSILGGRSGNRGRCAQPCRLPYEVEGNKNGAYVLSPKDLCTISLIPKLCQAGIDSFKIEGRMKNPEYVATIVSIYRKYVDAYLANPEGEYNVEEDDWQLLLEAYNRGGFTEGYYEQHNGPAMMSMERPNHQGLKAGVIEKVRDGKIYFSTEIQIHKGDLIEVELPGEEENIMLTSPEDCEKGQMFSLNARKLKSIKPGFSVYRTGNPWMKKQLSDHLLSLEKKISLKGRLQVHVNQPVRLELTLEDGRQMIIEGDMVSPAKDRPMTADQVKKPLLQTGTSRFDFTEILADMDENAFIPLGAVKKLRRQGFEALEQMLMNQNRRQDPVNAGCWQTASKGTKWEEQKKKKQQNLSADGQDSIPELRVSAEDKEKAEVLLSVKEVDAVYIPFEEYGKEERRELLRRAEQSDKKIFYALPYVFRNPAQKKFVRQWEEIKEEKPAGILIRNIDELAWIAQACKKEVPSFEMILDQSLYIYNKEAVSMYKEWMKTNYRHTFPLELNGEEWKSLSLENGEMIVYGRIPLMVSAQCVTNHTKGCMGNPGYVTMTDRYQKKFYLRRHCSFCYNTIWNGVPLSLQGLKKELEDQRPSSLRLHFTIEKEEEMRQIIRTFYEEWNGLMISKNMRGDFTRGHYKRGIE